MAGFPGGPLDQQRLDSWKEIGAFFGRDERTVKRWERERGLPVHRVPGSGRGRVYAYSHELREWLRGAGVEAELGSTADAADLDPHWSSGSAAGGPAKNGAAASSGAASPGLPSAAVSASGAVWGGEDRRKISERGDPCEETRSDSTFNDSARSATPRSDVNRADLDRGDPDRSDGGRADAGRTDGALAQAEPLSGRSLRLALVPPSRDSGARREEAVAPAAETDPKPGLGTGAATEVAASRDAKSSRGARLVQNAQRWAMGAVAVALVAAGTAGYLVHRERAARAAEAQPEAVTASAHAEAEDLYLKGVYYWQKRTPESLQQAVDYYTQAIVHDPGYAPAYAGLAECYDLLREYTTMPESEAYPRAIAAAGRAIALDPNLAQAHSALGFALFWWQRDIPRAMAELEKALELDPRSATAHHWYATALMMIGRREEAQKQIEMARKLDPGSEAILADKAYILWRNTGSEEAKQTLLQLEKSNPQYYSPHHYLADIAFEQGDGRAYAAEMRASAALKADPEKTRWADLTEKAFATGGWPAVMQALYGDVRQQYAAGQASAMTMAVWEARMGHRDAALHYLSEAVKANDPGLLFLMMDPAWGQLRDTEQYRTALHKAGLV